VSCDFCQQWQCQPPDWRVLDHNGVPQRRPRGVKPPCKVCPKIPPGLPKWQEPRPALGVELSDENRRVWGHYRRCAAVNWNVPDAADDVVQCHADIIARATEAAEADRMRAAARAAAERAEERDGRAGRGHQPEPPRGRRG
jgi:hypothetical protein